MQVIILLTVLSLYICLSRTSYNLLYDIHTKAYIVIINNSIGVL